MMLADELEADWSTIRVEQAPVIPEIYQNLSTGGSGATETAWDYMRKAGAQAREMLFSAAAQQWGVEKKDCRAENGTVFGPSGRLGSALLGSVLAARFTDYPRLNFSFKGEDLLRYLCNWWDIGHRGNREEKCTAPSSAATFPGTG
jgi:CO/xanthine dehydrogenase Mo-binding subunit